MSAYYNEIDPYAAAWLRNLIAGGQIAPGDVDERSIEDVRPDDLRGYTQCHFFAGIGVWSYALRLAGWPDDRPVWTGSCPCQPFSAAGKGAGFDDERHLWPAWFHLIEQCRPHRIFGEQVASKDGLGWLDLVFADLEGAHYAVGAFDTCSAGSGAPHIRQRLRIAAVDVAHAAGDGARRAPGDGDRAQGAVVGVDWGASRSSTAAWLRSSSRGVVDRQQQGLEGHAGHGHGGGQPGWLGAAEGRSAPPAGGVGGLEHGTSHGWQQRRPEPGERSPASGCGDGRLADGHGDRRLETGQRGTSAGHDGALGDGSAGRLADEFGNGWRSSGHGHHAGHDGPQPDADGCDGGLAFPDRGQRGGIAERGGYERHGQDAGWAEGRGGLAPCGQDGRPGPTGGFWRAADWLFCRDGKWRPVEPGTFPLVDGAAFKLGSGSAFEGLSRQGMLKGYGNAVDAQATADFIAAFLAAEAGESDGGAPLMAAQSDIGAR